MADRDKGFGIAFGVTRFVMHLEGIWPGFEKPRTGIARLGFLPAALMMGVFINVAQTLELPRVQGHLNVIIDILTFADIPIFIALVKHLGVAVNQEALRKLLFTIADDWKRVSSEMELKVMLEKARLSRVFTMVEVSLSSGRLIVHTIRMVHAMIQPYPTDPVTGDYMRPYYMRGHFVYDAQKTPLYEITWGCQFVAVAFSGCAICSADMFFVATCFHLCGQLTNLQQEIRELVKNDYDRKLSSLYEMTWFLRMANTVERCFNKMFLIQVTASSMIVCLHGYSLVMVLFEQEDVVVELIFMAFFTIGFMYSMFVYCYVAECLGTESASLSDAIFQCKWYALSAREAKMLLIPLQFASKPIQITAGKFVVFSLNLFANIVKTSAAYLSMLLAVRDKI